MTGSGAFRTLLCLGAAVLALAGAGAFFLFAGRHPPVIALMLAGGVLYAATAWWLLRQERRLSGRRILLAILGVAVVARALLLFAPPVSTDIFRYVWDGRVQAAGINPYRYVPADPAVAHLRDAAIYPHMNRKDTAVTIYPPASQMVFFAATRLGETVTVMKAVMLAFEGLLVFALLRLLRRQGHPDARIALYAWHPLPLFEFAGSGHVDVVAIALLLVAMLVASERRPFLAGLALGAGAGAKFFPAFAAPALWRPFDWRLPAGLVLALGLFYLPYLGVGRGVLGFLGGYVDEEAGSGGGIVWLALASRLQALPAWSLQLYLSLAAAGLLAFGLVVAFRRRAETVSAPAAAALLAAFLVVAAPHYAWYFTWLVPFLCFSPSAALIWLTVAAPLLYGFVWPFERLASETLLYGPFLLILAAQALRSRNGAPTQEVVDGRLA